MSSRFLSSRFAGLQPYTPGEQPQGRRFVKLNTNESPYPPPPAVVQAAAQAAAGVQLYNDPDCRALLAAMARHFGCGQDQVFASNGSDETLAFCFEGLCPNGVAFADLTYGFYPIYAEYYGLDAKVVPLQADFSLAPDDYFGLGRTIFIVNPNAPSGLAISPADIAAIARENPDNLVIIDEAYVDFGAESAVPLVDMCDNLLVVGTFSKSRSMAGARLGYAVGSPAVIADLHRLRNSTNPYNINSMTQAMGIAALAEEAYYRDCCAAVMRTRDETLQRLRALGFTCTESLTNFVLAHTDAVPAETLQAALRERGFLVRRFPGTRVVDYLRISIGTGEDMQALCRALAEIVAKPG